MSNDISEGWVGKTGSGDLSGGVSVVSRPRDRGNRIVSMARELRPCIAKMFEGVRDENRMIVQPGRLQAIALNVAQHIVDKETAAVDAERMLTFVKDATDLEPNTDALKHCQDACIALQRPADKGRTR